MTDADSRIALAGARAAMALPAWIVGFSLLGVGSLARDAGHSVWVAMFSTVVIYAAPAQLILYTMLTSGSSVLAVAIAVGFSAIRLMPMTIAILPYLRRPGQSLVEQCLLAHPVAATVWIENMRRLPEMEPEARVPFYAGFATTCVALCTAMTGIGYLLVGALPVPLAAGLMCLTPIYFTVSMTGGARTLGEWLAVGLGLALLPIAGLAVGRNFDIVVAGLVGGSLAYGADYAKRHRRRPA